MNDLQAQIKETSRTIYTDSYSMSVGELMSMYQSNEIDVHPEFQRNYRWELETKSKLIESLLLGIPIPPIFVFQNESGVWDVIDGHQRLSTIFECAGIYIDERGEKQPPLKLTKGKFLTALEGIVWEDIDENAYQFTTDIRILVKRAKIDIKILKSNSDTIAKYDLFQRLNTGGQALTPQEIRNCLIIMEDAAFYEKLNSMRRIEAFKNCLPLSENAINSQEDMEYIVRFIVARNCDIDIMPSSLHDYFDDSIINLIRTKDFNIDKEIDAFNTVFVLLNSLLGEDTFKKYYKDQDKFRGSVTLSAYEAIVPVISKNILGFESINPEKLINRIKNMHDIESYTSLSRRRSTDRYKNLISFGKQYFNIEEVDSWQ
jgi:uncharacterized protein with ParB-like and HNH nuclease domain